MAKRWKPEDITYLKRYASKRRLAQLAERYKTDPETVEAKLIELGLAAHDMVVAPNLASDNRSVSRRTCSKACYLFEHIRNLDS